MRVRLERFVLGALIGAVVLGCGGGGGSSPAAGLSGIVNTADFSIPAGTTRTVTGDLQINSTGAIEIDGTLVVPQGVSVTLISGGPLSIKGNIKASAATTASVTERGGGGAPTFSIGGPSISVSGGISLPIGTTALVCTRGAGSVTISGIYTPPGKDSKDQSLPGGDGGAIEIGTPAAIEFANEKGETDAAAPATILVSGLVSAGSGGRGFTDTKGVNDGTTITAHASNGGNGGDVTMVATTSITVGGSVYAGDGGDGGDCTVTAPDQTSPHKKGINVVGTTGDGGNGGSISMTPAPSGANIRAGHKGWPGSAKLVAGKGGSGDGDGGDATVIGGDMGKDGTGATPAQEAPVETYILTGGKGANAEDAAENGGKGGSVTLSGKTGGAIPQPTTNPLMNAGAGGDGFGACGAAKQTPGSNGGAAGKIVIHGLRYTAGTVKGGDGGDGDGPGTGGAAATDDAGKTVGKPGNPGKSCGGTGLHVTNTVSTSTNNPSFCSLDATSGQIAVTSADINKMDFCVLDLHTLMSQTWSCPGAISDVNSSVANGNTSTRGNNVVFISSSAANTVYVFNETTGAQSTPIKVPSWRKIGILWSRWPLWHRLRDHHGPALCERSRRQDSEGHRRDLRHGPLQQPDWLDQHGHSCQRRGRQSERASALPQ
ncbi:MAG TPA: hypothetical protein VG944_19860 [Fimbriimonas sp.]|nr:hypothetical protein [Fimbriimonas sp.]